MHTYPEGIDKLVEREAVVLRGLLDVLLGESAIVVAPELLVLEHNLLEIFEADDHRVDLAQLAQLEELDGRDLHAVA